MWNRWTVSRNNSYIWHIHKNKCKLHLFVSLNVHQKWWHIVGGCIDFVVVFCDFSSMLQSPERNGTFICDKCLPPFATCLVGSHNNLYKVAREMHNSGCIKKMYIQNLILIIKSNSSIYSYTVSTFILNINWVSRQKLKLKLKFEFKGII